MDVAFAVRGTFGIGQAVGARVLARVAAAFDVSVGVAQLNRSVLGTAVRPKDVVALATLCTGSDRRTTSSWWTDTGSESSKLRWLRFTASWAGTQCVISVGLERAGIPRAEVMSVITDACRAESEIVVALQSPEFRWVSTSTNLSTSIPRHGPAWMQLVYGWDELPLDTQLLVDRRDLDHDLRRIRQASLATWASDPRWLDAQRRVRSGESPQAVAAELSLSDRVFRQLVAVSESTAEL